MALLTSLGNAAHAPSRLVWVGGQPVTPVSIDVELTIDGVSSQATIELASVPSSLNFRDNVRIDLGYDGFLSTVFTGEVEDDGRGYFPFTNTIKAVGPLHLAQFQYPTEVSYTSQTDLQIVTDLLNVRAGITKYDLDSDGTTLGTVQDVVLRAGETPFSLINQIDQVFGYYTFDCPDGVVRRRLITGIPAQSPAFTYEQGDPSTGNYRVFRVSRPRTVRGIHNKVIVTGLPQSASTPSATRQAANAYVPTPPTYYAYSFDSDLIEGTAVASSVALRLMTEVNRILEEIEIEVPGNPYIVPGVTSVALIASKVGLSTATPFFVKTCRHRFDERGFTSTLTLIGGVGDAGYELSKPPEACFSVLFTRETWGGTTYYTAAADASCTTDPDTNQGSITCSWSNNENGDTGTALVYYTKFTAAEFNTGTASITLVASDPDGNSGTITQTLDGTADVVIARVTADIATNTSQFEATPNGGSVWNTYAVSSARATPKIGAASAQHFGAGTTLYESDDYLATTPTAIHSFSGTINDIWINEVDANRITVGLDTGDVYVTTDSSDGTASTWTNLVTMPASVKRIVESFEQAGQYWTASSNAIWLTFDSFGAKAQHISFASTATARDIALSNFANYGCATGGGGSTDCVKREDGVSIVPTDGAADIYTITHHIRDDILYGAGVSGTNTIIYSKAPGGTAFDPIGTIAGGGTPWTMLRDGDNPGVIYLAHDAALSKTYDGGTTWVTLRSGNGPYLQVGYGSAPLQPASTPGTVYYGSNGGLSRRVNPGVWELVQHATITGVYAMDSPKGIPDTVYVVVGSPGLSVSSLVYTTDAFATVSTISSMPGTHAASEIRAIACQTGADVLYVGFSNGDVYKTSDHGSNWTSVYAGDDTAGCSGIYVHSSGAYWLGDVTSGDVSNFGQSHVHYVNSSGTDWTFPDPVAVFNNIGWVWGIPGDDAHAFGKYNGLWYLTPNENSGIGTAPEYGDLDAALSGVGTSYWVYRNATTDTQIMVTSTSILRQTGAPSSTGWALMVTPGTTATPQSVNLIPVVMNDPANTDNWWVFWRKNGSNQPEMYYSTDNGLTWTLETNNAYDALTGGMNNFGPLLVAG